MKKNFKLKIEGKNYDRNVEAAKAAIRKHIKRQYRKPLAEGVDFMDFDCKFSIVEADAKTIHYKEITDKINEAAAAQADGFYIEILNKPGYRTSKPKAAETDSEEINNDED